MIAPDLGAIARRYGGRVMGRECLIPTPGHSRQDRGTAIRLAPSAPDGLLVTCFNGGLNDALAVKDMLRRDGFLPERGNVRRHRLTPAETEAIRQAEAARLAERLTSHINAARICRQRLAAAHPADPGHPYLAAKRIASERLWQEGGRLLVPMVDVRGALWNIQSIGPDGRSKLFAKGARITGLFWWCGDVIDRLVIAEGMATAAAVRRATGLPVIAAMTAGNLATVARSIRTAFPQMRLTVAADDDPAGHKAAADAARSAGAGIVYPQGAAA